MNMRPAAFLVTALLFGVAVVKAAPNPNLAIDPDLELSLLASGIREGMEMTIASDGRVFIAERPGKVKLFSPDKPGQLIELIDLKSDTRCEAGLIGIALDPHFDQNQWIYLQHTVPVEGDKAHYEHRLGRFVFKDGKIDPASEKVLLKIRADSVKRIHESGSIAFGPDGLLYLSVGDNQMRSEYLYSCKTSANSNDLRGKILRIRPTKEGGYEIPEGNLFPPGTPKTLPEIYIMGLRNPFRIHVDQKTGWLLWGENGPPNNWAPGTKLDKKTIPLGYDEFNLAKGPGFYGYPLVIADQQPFTHYDHDTKKGGPIIDPKAPLNLHKGNTGIRELPPAQPPLIWYEGNQKEFPELGGGGESAIAGPIFRKKATYSKKLGLPDQFDACWLIGEYSRGWVKAVKLNDKGEIEGIRPVLPTLRLGKPTNLKIGPKGRLHVLYYTKDDKGVLVRLENKGATEGAIAPGLVMGLESPPRQLKKSKEAWAGYQLMNKSDCLNCHQWTRAFVAPPYFQIAERYKADPTAAETLTQKVLKGGVGVWGQIPMVPHPQHSAKDARAMVDAILYLNQLKPKK
jgi:cytochrome c